MSGEELYFGDKFLMSLSACFFLKATWRENMQMHLPLLVTELTMAPSGMSVLLLLVDKVAAVTAAGCVGMPPPAFGKFPGTSPIPSNGESPVVIAAVALAVDSVTLL